MIICMRCGMQLEEDAKFCARCGVRLAAEHLSGPPYQHPPQTALQLSTLTPAPMPPTPQLPPQRLCTKCGVTLRGDVLFCPGCGTKNYVFQLNKARQGELLMALRGCQLIKLQIIKTAGTLFIYDDRIFFQSDAPGGNIVIPYAELTAAAPNSGSGLTIRLACVNGKSYVFTLSEDDADMYYYIINLITDYRF